MPIELLNERAYRGYLEAVTDSGVEPIHIARICFADGVTRRAYVKLYSEKSKGVVNEITGHLLASATGLRTPTRAALVFVPKEAVPDLPPWARRLRSATVLAWCTEDMSVPSIKLHFNLRPGLTSRQAQPVIDELKRSKDIPSVIALDDWIANVDRNLGNLLRLANREYLLIDHGRLFGGPTWAADTLPDQGQLHHNVLRVLLDSVAHSNDYRSDLAHIAREKHAAALLTACEELLVWWCDLLDEREIEAAAAFLDARAEVDNICARYHVLPV